MVPSCLGSGRLSLPKPAELSGLEEQSRAICLDIEILSVRLLGLSGRSELLNVRVTKRIALTAALLGFAALLLVVAIDGLERSATSPIGFVGAVLLALVFWAAVRKTDATGLLRSLEGLRLFLPILAFELVSQLVGESAASLAFDQVAAEVIAVFLLALALEARFFHLHRVKEPLELGAMLFTLILLGSGEFYALQGIATQQPDHADLISGAVAAGFVAVAIAALIGPGLKAQEDQN